MGSVIKSLSKERYKTVKSLCHNGFGVSKNHSVTIKHKLSLSRRPVLPVRPSTLRRLTFPALVIDVEFWLYTRNPNNPSAVNPSIILISKCIIDTI